MQKSLWPLRLSDRIWDVLPSWALLLKSLRCSLPAHSLHTWVPVLSHEGSGKHWEEFIHGFC